MTSSVQGLAELRNKLGDAHGPGRAALGRNRGTRAWRLALPWWSRRS
ncbi:MAG: abortive infection family protein [Chloroflexi bacterium]|nr:abortive infection family protein [Chloroflexota bacterium]